MRIKKDESYLKVNKNFNLDNTIMTFDKITNFFS